MTSESEHARRAIEHVVAALELIPTGTPAAVLMRHAERGDIPKGTSGGEALLTPRGERDAERMGSALRGRMSVLRHSPVPRCRQTALQIQRGAGGPAPAEWLPLVHALMDDPALANLTMRRMVDEEGFYDQFILAMSTSNDAPYPGFIPPLAASARLAAQMAPDKGGICVNITHDWLINVAASRALGQEAGRPDYAEFMDALFLWEKDGRLTLYYKGRISPCARDFQRKYEAFRAQREPGDD